MARYRDKDQQRLSVLLNHLESCKRTQNEKASFSGADFSTIRVLISRLMSVDKSIPESDKHRLVTKAVFCAAGKHELTLEILTKELRRVESEYLSTHPKEFRMVGQLSVQPQILPKRVRVLNTTITFGIDDKNQLVRNHRNKVGDLTQASLPPFPNSYYPFSVACRARTSSHAFALANKSLELWRGCFNLALNFRKITRFSFDGRRPVNQVATHPIFTVHNKNGSSAGNEWYYEPAYQIPVVCNLILKDAVLAQKTTRKILKRLAVHNYSEKVIDGITRYVHALDSANFESGLVELWAICESLTESTKSSGDVTVRRISSIYSNKQYVDVILGVLQEYRNRAVHFGEQTQDIESLLFHIKGFVEGLLRFHLFNSFNFSNIGEAAEFLDLVRDKQALSKKHKLLSMAIDRASI